MTNHQVQLALATVDITALDNPWRPELSIHGTHAEVCETATAWANVRNWPTLAAAIATLAEVPPPESGWHLLIHKPRSIAIFMTWPWAPPEARASTGLPQP